MSLSVIVAFLLLAIPSFVTPGPNNLMLMASGAKFGVRRTLPHMLGINVGFPVMLFLVGLGLGEVFTAYPMVETVVKWLAAAYFSWMAWKLLGLRVGNSSGSARPLRFYEAALFQWVNPKAWVLAVSFVAAFVGGGEGRLVGLGLLALGCLLVGPFASLIWLVAGRELQAFLVRTGSERYLGAILAIVMLVAVILFLI